MHGFNVFLHYVALKGHFTSKSQNSYKVIIGKLKSFNDIPNVKRRYTSNPLYPRRAEWLVNNYGKQAVKVLLSNFAYRTDYKFFPDFDEKYLTNWERVNKSLNYHFRKDLEHLREFSGDFKKVLSEHAWSEFLQGNIEVETLVLLDRSTNVFKFYDRAYQDDPLWSEYSLRLKKLGDFVHLNKETLNEIISDVFYED